MVSKRGRLLNDRGRLIIGLIIVVGVVAAAVTIWMRAGTVAG